MKKEYKKKMAKIRVCIDVNLVKKAKKLNPNKSFEKYCRDLIYMDNQKRRLIELTNELKEFDKILGCQYVTNIIQNRSRKI
jgi:hypothetical protein